ncbi:MAG: hypothetical protein HGA38_00335 [Candidatus Moranbacteria bacterium]|nr:hypothetical protein [Candidatus Moranbacteria bacterium]NTW45983.1 hypothetical protein [Candidatus Moranbacteria bacterium]
MTYSFNLNIDKESSRLVLLKDVEEIVSREWPESRDMGRQLFEAIDGILTETGLVPADVPSFGIETDVSDSFTSVKIGESVAKAWEFGTGDLKASNGKGAL